jgi:c(7)-type cytochrome triheme protein
MLKGVIPVVFLLAPGLTMLVAQDKAAPEKLVFEAKSGSVAFDHATHAKREKGDCKVCHPRLFAEDSKAPLAFKPPHKREEDKKGACGFCHRPGGVAFETKSNCTNGKCHTKPASRRG